MTVQLKLYEELMLLALCEEKGTIAGSYITYALLPKRNFVDLNAGQLR